MTAGNEQARQMMVDKEVDGETLTHPVANLRTVLEMPPRTMCIMQNAQDHLSDSTVRQAVGNCRDVMKGNHMTLVMMVPSVNLPESLSHDVMVIHDPLPDEKQIEAIVRETVSAATAATAIKRPTKKNISDAVSSMKGLSSFEVEQATALTLDQLSCLDARSMFERRNSFVENVKGLSVDRFDKTYDDIRGIERAKWFCERLFNGPESPHVILRIDELDKKLGGVEAHMERQGATQGDELNVLLETMEDEGWSGQIDYGQPGSGKTMLTRTTGPTFGVQTLVLDLGGTRSKYVGESEANVREAMRTVKAIGGSRVYVMATCNELNFKPELKRRFTDGVFFFDLPDKNERELLWALYMKQYDIKRFESFDDTDWKGPFNDTGWTGAEIRNACWLAYRLNIPLKEAVEEVIPIAKADPESVTRRQRLAHNTFKSAHEAGIYRIDLTAKNSVRPSRSFKGDSE
jgi:hypothetical protein|tara:strand:+ start:8622 stop:10001 length:1380 start_codon:yes stop_codon:yes gene_type:complete